MTRYKVFKMLKQLNLLRKRVALQVTKESIYACMYVICALLRKIKHLRWLDPVFLGGYHPTLKLSGIPTFTFIVNLTHRMDNI